MVADGRAGVVLNCQEWWVTSSSTARKHQRECRGQSQQIMGRFSVTRLLRRQDHRKCTDMAIFARDPR
jgi:hypothetical protein